MEGFIILNGTEQKKSDDRAHGGSLRLAFHALFFLMLPALGIFVAQPVAAATLYPAPASGSYNVGDTFTVGVYVSSPDQAMNAVSGALSVSRERLEIVSVAPGSSIVNLWVRDPAYSATAGTADFEGIVLNPGFKGSGGQIMVMTLKAIAPGVGSVNLNSGVVLANDGHGTNILRGLGTAQFTIIGVDIPAPQEEPEDVRPQAPEEPASDREQPTEPLREQREPKYPFGAPVVVSETHPDPNAWYAANDVKLSWTVPTGASAVRVLVSGNPHDAPTVLYDTPIDSLDLYDLKDGVWYLHVQFRDSGWSEITHFKFQIDTQEPEPFELTEAMREDPTDPVVRFGLNATDTTSGISYYDVSIEGRPLNERVDGALKEFHSSALAPGDRTILVRAVDGAGNARERELHVRIEPLAAPVILQYPLSLKRGDMFFLRGTSQYPNAYVTVWVRAEDGETASYEAFSDGNGDISFLTKESLPKGVVDIWLTLKDERGAQSDPSERVSIEVRGLLLSDLWPWLSYSLFIIAAALVYLLRRNWCQLAALRKQLKGGGGNEGYAELERELVALRKEVEKTERVRRKVRPSRRTSRPGTKARVRRKPSSAASGKKYIIGNWRGKKQAE